MDTLAEKLGLIERHTSKAIAAVAGEAGASPVLRAVMKEFESKANKAREVVGKGAAQGGSREVIVEVEEAADCAKLAALADPGVSAETRKLVEVAHDALCMLKHEQAAAGT